MRYVSWGHHAHIIRSASRAKRPQKQQAIPTPCKWWQGTAKQPKNQNNTKERHRFQLGFFLFGLLDADRGPVLCFLTRGGNCSVSAIAVATMPPRSTSFRPCQLASCGSEMSGNFSEHRNGKPAPKDIGDWINLQASPKVWICGLALTLAENWPRHSHFLGRRLTEDGSGPHLQYGKT